MPLVEGKQAIQLLPDPQGPLSEMDAFKSCGRICFNEKINLNLVVEMSVRRVSA